MEDHPRTCGEKSDTEEKKKSDEGSPPHMRGKASLDEKVFCVRGITPAHAGKRLNVEFACCFYRDHPRTCGEKYNF